MVPAAASTELEPPSSPGATFVPEEEPDDPDVPEEATDPEELPDEARASPPDALCPLLPPSSPPDELLKQAVSAQKPTAETENPMRRRGLSTSSPPCA